MYIYVCVCECVGTVRASMRRVMAGGGMAVKGWCTKVPKTIIFCY